MTALTRDEKLASIDNELNISIIQTIKPIKFALGGIFPTKLLLKRFQVTGKQVRVNK